MFRSAASFRNGGVASPLRADAVYDLTFTFDDNSTQVITNAKMPYKVNPALLNRNKVKKIAFSGTTFEIDFSKDQRAGYSFKRASIGYATDAAGDPLLYQRDQLRKDFTGGSFAGILLEPEAFNILLNSEPPATSIASLTYYNIVSPVLTNGVTLWGTPFRKVIPNATNGTHVYQMLLFPNKANTQYTLSYVAKQAGYSTIMPEFNVGMLGSPTNRVPVINLASGDVTQATDVATSATSLSDGSYLVSHTFTTGSSPTANLPIYLNVYGSFTGDTVSGVDLGRFQLEEGPAPSSYIPTVIVGETARRAPDELILGGSANDGLALFLDSPEDVAKVGTFSRTGPAWRINQSMTLEEVTSGPRIDYDINSGECLGLRYEPDAATNFLPNSVMSGAAVGSLPTDYIVYTPSGGVSLSVVGTGFIKGMRYIDVRYNGTPTSTSMHILWFGPVNTVSTEVGQVYTASHYAQIVGGNWATTITECAAVITENLNNTSFYAESYGVYQPPRAHLGRFQHTRTITAPTASPANGCRGGFGIRFANTGAVDVTIRLVAPQLEAGFEASSYIPTSGSPVTRNAESMSPKAVSWFKNTGTIDVDFRPATKPVKNTGVKDVQTVLSLSDGTLNNYHRVVTNGYQNYPSVGYEIESGGADMLHYAAPNNTTNADSFYRNFNVATSFTDGDVRTAVDGVVIGRNQFPNARMRGGVAGTNTSLPRDWGRFVAGGLSVDYAYGTEYGMEYMQCRIYGTPSSSPIIQLLPETSVTKIASKQGEVWNNSLYLRLTAGNFTNVSSATLRFYEYTAAGTGLGTLISTNLGLGNITTALTRFNRSFTVAGATCDFVRANLSFSGNLSPVDFTIRIYRPMLERSSAAPSDPMLGRAANRDYHVSNATMPVGINSIRIGALPDGSSPFTGWIRSINFNDAVSTNKELETVSYPSPTRKIRFDGSLPADVTFTRSSTVTKDAVGSADPISIPVNEPRFDTDGALFLEPPRTPIWLNNSKNFSSASWSKVALTISGDRCIASSGTASLRYLSQVNSGSYSFGSPYCSFFDVKMDTHRYVQIWFSSSCFTLAADVYANFDLQDGVVGNKGSGIIGAGIIPLGDGVYRIWASAMCNFTASGQQSGIAFADSLTTGRIATLTMAGTESFFIYRAQHTYGSYITSFIPTAGTAVTRQSEICSIPLGVLPFNNNEFTIEVIVTIFNTNPVVALPNILRLYSSTSEYIEMYVMENTLEAIGKLVSGTTQAETGAAIPLNTKVKITIVGKLNNFVIRAGDNVLMYDDSCSMPRVQYIVGMYLGSDGGSAGIYGKIHEVNVWPMKLLDNT